MTSKAFQLSQLGDIVAVSNTGNIGIGTNPTADKLTVGGSANFSGTVTIQGLTATTQNEAIAIAIALG